MLPTGHKCYGGAVFLIAENTIILCIPRYGYLINCSQHETLLNPSKKFSGSLQYANDSTLHIALCGLFAPR